MPGGNLAPASPFPSQTRREPAGPRTAATRRPVRSKIDSVATAFGTNVVDSAKLPAVGFGPRLKTDVPEAANLEGAEQHACTVSASRITSVPPLAVVTMNLT